MASTSESQPIVAPSNDQEDSEWEYEYHPTERETHFITLNLPSAAPIPSRKRRRGGNVASTGPSEQIQILGLHTDKPIVSFRSQAYECSWNKAIGTDIIFGPPPPPVPEPAQPPESSTTSNGKEKENEATKPSTPLLTTDHFTLHATTRVKLSGKPVKIIPTIDRSTTIDDPAAPPQPPPIPFPLSDAATQSHRRQAKFLSTLAGMKRARGETDKVFLGQGFWDGREEFRERQDFQRRTAVALAEGLPPPEPVVKRRPGRKPKVPKQPVEKVVRVENRQREQTEGRGEAGVERLAADDPQEGSSSWGGLPPGVVIEDELDSDPDDWGNWGKDTSKITGGEDGEDVDWAEDDAKVYDWSGWFERPGTKRGRGRAHNNVEFVSGSDSGAHDEEGDEDEEGGGDEEEVDQEAEVEQTPRRAGPSKRNQGFSKLGGGLFRDIYDENGDGAAGKERRDPSSFGFTYREAPDDGYYRNQASRGRAGNEDALMEDAAQDGDG